MMWQTLVYRAQTKIIKYVLIEFAKRVVYNYKFSLTQYFVFRVYDIIIMVTAPGRRQTTTAATQNPNTITEGWVEAGRF